MKKYVKILGAALLGSVAFTSCNDLLDEQPRALIVPAYFETETGALGGITSAYSDLRDFHSSEGPLAAMIAGTDEATLGSAGGGGTRTADVYSIDGVSSITPSSGAVSDMWGQSFAPINTLNGVLEKGTTLGLAPEILAEAHFLRAYYYFYLVRTFGGVPLDLGAGPLAFNTNPTSSSVRNTVDEVYTAILNDLDYAVTNLLDKATATRSTAVTKAAAYHFRAKAYLTYGWLLENAGTFTQAFNKPTGALQGGTITSQQAFQKAYDDAKYLIDNAATFGRALYPYYEDVHALEGEYGSETLMLVDRTNDQIYNEQQINGNTGNKTSVLNMLITAYYENYGFISNGNRPMNRNLADGRPWRRMAPTYETIANTFADKTNDSRYDAQFQKVWYVNRNIGLAGEAGRPIAMGDTAWYMPGYDNFVAPAGANYRVWLPRQMTTDMFPTIKKWIDPAGHIIENATGNGTTRPFVTAKLSETYLILAEAALKLNKSNSEIRGYILTLRERAALRRSNTAEQNAAAVAAVREATPETIDLVYIMMERSRELWGEFLRWHDLQRTRLLDTDAIVGLKTAHIVNWSGENPPDAELGQYGFAGKRWSELTSAQQQEIKRNPYQTTITRAVMPHHYLRPIPQGQFDAMDEASREGYQNAGY